MSDKDPGSEVFQGKIILPGQIEGMVGAKKAPIVLTRSVRHASGNVEISDPDSPLIQGGETLRCVHCQMHWIVQPGSGKSRGFCFNCNGVTCGKEKCEKFCVPFEKDIEIMEGRDPTISQF